MSRALTAEEGQIPVCQLITVCRGKPLGSALGEGREAVKELMWGSSEPRSRGTAGMAEHHPHSSDE